MAFRQSYTMYLLGTFRRPLVNACYKRCGTFYKFGHFAHRNLRLLPSTVSLTFAGSTSLPTLMLSISSFLMRLRRIDAEIAEAQSHLQALIDVQREKRRGRGHEQSRRKARRADKVT